jgi:hypothetical protein
MEQASYFRKIKKGITILTSRKDKRSDFIR